MVGAEFVYRPFEALEDHVACDEFDFVCVLVPKCVDGCGGFGVWEFMYTIRYPCPYDDWVLLVMPVSVLSHRFIAHVILLVFECDGYCCSCVEHFPFSYFSIAMAEYDVVTGDDLGFSCAGCL